VREGAISPREALVQRDLFLEDVEEGVWELLPVSDTLLREVERFTRTLPSECFLRAGDAIHLVTAMGAGFRELWTNDRHLKAAAVLSGLTGRSVPMDR
jgi:predicted nucleic acid-binding protein